MQRLLAPGAFLRAVVLLWPILAVGGLAPAAATEPPASPAAPRVLKIDSVEGSAKVRRGKTMVPATPGMAVREADGVELGLRSRARLSVGDQTLIDLGPSAKLRVLQLGRSDGSGLANLRLDAGYLRIVWADPEGKGDRPAAISFGRWAAMLSSGEFFFEVRGPRARACGLAGALTFAGAGGDLPKSLSGACADLPAAKQATTVTPTAQEWQAMREQFTLRLDPARTVAKPESPPLPAAVAAAAQARAASGTDRPAYLLVEAVTGSAKTERDGQPVELAIGQRLEQGQSIQTGDDSGVRVSMKDEDTPFDLGPTFEIGPQTRATVRKLPAPGSAPALWMRLEEGAMVVLREPGENASVPLEVSFADWAARLKVGEFFLESHAGAATACRLSGDMSLAGVPATLPETAVQTCTGLKVNEAPTDVPLPEIAALRDIVGVQRILRSQLPVPYIIGPTSRTGAMPGTPRAVEASLRPTSATP